MSPHVVRTGTILPLVMRLLFVLLLLLLPASFAARAQTIEDQQIRAQRLLVRALTHVQTGDTEQALDALETALNFAPDDPAVLAALSGVHRDRGDLPAAVFFAERAVDAAPARAESHFHLADVYVDAGEEARAAEILREVTEDADWNDAVAARAISFLVEHRMNGDAEALLVDALASAGPRTALLSAGVPLFGDGYPLLDAVQTAARRNHLSAPDALALLWWTTGSDQPELHSWVIDYISREHPDVQLPAAYLAFDSPRHQTPSDADVDVASHVDHDPAAAAVQREAMVEEDPRSADNWIAAAAAYLRAGLPADALRLSEEASILFPGNTPIATLVVRAYLELGDTTRAQLGLQQLPDAPLTSVLAMHGRQTDAGRLATQGENALEAAPDDWLVAAYAVLHQPQDAEFLQDAQTWLSDHQDHVLAMEALGWAYFLQGDVTQAAQLLEQAASVGAPRPRLVQRLAEIYQQSGRTSDAERLRATLD